MIFEVVLGRVKETLNYFAGTCWLALIVQGLLKI